MTQIRKQHFELCPSFATSIWWWERRNKFWALNKVSQISFWWFILPSKIRINITWFVNTSAGKQPHRVKNGRFMRFVDLKTWFKKSLLIYFCTFDPAVWGREIEESDVAGREEAAVDGLLLKLVGVVGLLSFVLTVARWLTVPLGVRCGRPLVLLRVRLVDRPDDLIEHKKRWYWFLYLCCWSSTFSHRLAHCRRPWHFWI